MHHRRPAAPHSHRPNHRQINRLMPFTTAPLFHALQLLETGDSARGFTCPGTRVSRFSHIRGYFCHRLYRTYGTGNPVHRRRSYPRCRGCRRAVFRLGGLLFFLTGGSTQGILAMLGTAVRTRRRCPARPRGTQVRLLRLRAARHYAVFLFCTADRAIRGFRRASGQGCGSTADCASGDQGNPSDLSDLLRHPAGDS